jgi:hypothetical protein
MPAARLPAKKGRSSRAPVGKNRNINISPSGESRDWIDPHVGAGKRWSSYTHFFDYAVRHFREEEERVKRKG